MSVNASHLSCARCGVKPRYRKSYCRECMVVLDRQYDAAAKKRYGMDRRDAYANRNAIECAECGVVIPLRGGSNYDGQLCHGCEAQRRHLEARRRTLRWLGLRREGMANYEIADSEAVSAPVVANALQRSRVARFPDLEWLPAPYAAARGLAA